METYRAAELSFAYPEQEFLALDGLTFSIQRGEFVTLCGPSGCGKTTLLKQLKPALTPHGDRSGSICFEGTELSAISLREQSSRIGFVMQSPDNQIVTDKVWHELAFGLESLGLDNQTIRLRTAEMASFFGIQTWFYKSVTELSGGQKQLLNLASIMAMQPSVLILDEPTSQLDPIAANEFLATIGKINRELGTTVILTEHRLEEAFPLSDRVIVMDKGKIICDGTPQDVGLRLRGCGHGMFLAMPTAMRIWAGASRTIGGDCPVTIRDGRNWLAALNFASRGTAASDIPLEHDNAPTVELSELYFKYGRDLPDVIKALSFKAYSGEISAVLGGNGTGKTTALSLISGVNKPYRGEVKLYGSPLESRRELFNGLIGALPQNPQTLFVKKTVREDLREITNDENSLAQVIVLCRLSGLLERHPYDLSGGEQQRAALAKVLLTRPKIILLDEPTKGLDAEFKQIFASILRKLADVGTTVIMVSHDVEFCAEHADRCALFFDGSIVAEGTPREFFAGNSFYTSGANRMAREFIPDAITVNDVILALGGTVEKLTPEARIEEISADSVEYTLPETDLLTSPETKRKLSAKRKAVAVSAAVFLLATAIFAALNFAGLKTFISGGNEAVIAASDSSSSRMYIGIMLAFAAELIAITLALTWKRVQPAFSPLAVPAARKLNKRTIAASVMILLLIPMTIFIGVFYLGDRKYYFISLLIILETMLPFALIFESRKPQARELVVIAVLCAIAVAGRAAFFMLPQFKPLVAIVIIAGVAFGGESGFFVGAVSAFVSNMFFGQGPWTPWQMFAFGIIGFLGGVLFRKGILRRYPAALAIFGGLTTFIFYGGIMNTSMVLMYQSSPTLPMFLTSYLQGIPFDLVHGLATAVFLLIISDSMLEKLDRIKVKYGLVE
ncbi:MAG: ATP-binding cassette domain-containing protein [Oscillospiraceae bacterium]|jgi:energy-coupling factor transport system ATP-binding protein|nr:ATP-binding cassette domain-containing protein [Oscillospiraceae bacterium]